MSADLSVFLPPSNYWNCQNRGTEAEGEGRPWLAKGCGARQQASKERAASADAERAQEAASMQQQMDDFRKELQRQVTETQKNAQARIDALQKDLDASDANVPLSPLLE